MPRADSSIVKSGNMNRRIEIQEPIDTPDGQRGVTRTWETLPGCKRVPASMDYSPAPRKGDEAWVAHQVYPSSFVLFEIRYRPRVNISNIHRVVYGNRIFNIRSTSVPKERQTKIILQCEETQAKGSIH